jgi:hypothetical protein
MVCTALEDRNVPQNPEVRLQSRGIETANRRAIGQLEFSLLRLELENLLANDDQSNISGTGR